MAPTRQLPWQLSKASEVLQEIKRKRSSRGMTKFNILKLVEVNSYWKLLNSIKSRFQQSFL